MAYRGAKNESSEQLPGFRLYCRGGVRLYCGDQDYTPKAKKGRALLAVLAAEQRPLSRTKIIDLLWSDRQEEQARASLRTLLADLKEQFNSGFEDLLVVDRERVALRSDVRTDLTDPALARPAGELFEGLDHIDPELDEWLRTEREKWRAEPGTDRTAAADGTVPNHSPVRAQQTRLAVAALLLVALLALLAGAILRDKQQTAGIRIAVLPEQSGNILAELVAERLRDELLSTGIEVLGPETSKEIARAQHPAPALYRLFGVHRVYTATVRSAAGRTRYTGHLSDAESGSKLWSSHHLLVDQRPEGREAMLEQLVARLRESLDLPKQAAVPANWYRGIAGQWLAQARRLLRNDRPDDALAARRILLELVTAQPDNALALATLAEATMAASDHVYAGGSIPLADARHEAREYANRAIRHAPRAALGYAALGSSYMELAQAIPGFARAVALEPSNPMHRLRLARALEFEDRYAEAMAQNREAARLEPLSPQPMIGMIRAANQLGRHEEIRAAITHYATQPAPPDPSAIGYVKAYYAFLLDDNVGCLRHFGSSSAAGRDRRQRNILLFCLTALGENGRAQELVSDEDSLRRDVLAGDVDALEGRVRALGPAFWQRHYDSVAASEILVGRGRHAVLLDLFDRSYNSIEEFRSEGGFFTLYPQSLIVAFRAANRDQEARQLRDILFDTARKVAERDGADFWATYNGASVAMADGDKERAISLLKRCYPTCIFAMLQRDISENALFRPLRGNPRFDALVRRYRQFINRQRQTLGLPDLPLT